ncbi:uncharacterized protein LOC124132631 [Haliotis rufescens]|uniref:uncharacterized protein LOC124132631 n=1 Tax=Haliotis rufescens TaxID=6454 RepID=UPI00201EA450|nr:uncharacterized protein LOC124132631 [Haliotis rufescens]
MLLVLVTLSCLVAVQAQTLPCCMMDKQWSATMIDAQIMVKGNNVTSDFFYDGVNSSISIQYYEFGNTRRVRLNKTVTLYSKKVRYNISPDGNCTKKNITDLMLPYCIPDTALYRGSSYLGDEGSMLKIDGWHFPLGSLNITMSVSDYDCVPIIAGVAGMSDYSPFNTLLYFNGHKAGITDPTAFDVPSNC